MENGDIVSAGSDHAIRVWSRQADRRADPELLAVSFEARYACRIEGSDPVSHPEIRRGDSECERFVSASRIGCGRVTKAQLQESQTYRH